MNSAADSPSPTDSPVESTRAWLTNPELIAIFCVFVSGGLALIYEVCWIRKSSLIFGSTNYAVSTVLAVFFGGLAIGSHQFGRLSLTTARPLRLYGWLEIGIGILALLSTAMFSMLEYMYSSIYPIVSTSFTTLSLTRAICICIVVLPPTIMMGGTLPLICRQFVRSDRRVSGSVGLLYGINTLGAAIGCFVCGFVLIRYVGINATILAAGGVNILIGLIVLRLPVPEPSQAASLEAEAVSELGSASSDLAERHRTLGVASLFFFSGFVALGNEVLWTRFLSLMVPGNVYSYTMTLTLVLVGIVIGTVLTSRFFDRVECRAFLFGAVQILIGLFLLTILQLPVVVWSVLVNSSGQYADLGIAACVVLPPAILAGAGFPLAVRMVVERAELAGVGVGRIAALSTAGGIAGSLAVGFVMLPMAGMSATLRLTSAISILTGISAWLLLERRVPKRVLGILAVCSVALWVVIPPISGSRLPASFLSRGRPLIAYREGVRSHLAVVDSEFGLRLEIDQHWQGDQDSSHLLMAAHVPALLHRDPQTVLVVGLGPGRTASRFLMHDIKRLDCVEIERELIDVVRRYFDSFWMDDPRVSFIIEDGRNYLTYTDATYDLISIEVGQVFRPGAASFYSREFYLRARDRLNPGGVISQFVPLHFFDVDEFRTVTATFLSVFPDSILWYNTYELLLIGGVDHQPVLSENRLAQIEANKNLHDDLEFSYWNGPDHHLNRQPVLLASFLAGPDGLAKMVGDAEIYEDDRPFLEYSTVRQRFGQQSLDYIEDFVRRQTDHADLIQGHVDPVQMVVERRLSPDEIEAVHKTRLQNIGAIGARGHLTAADFFRFRNEMDQAIEHYRAALQRLPEHAEANSFLAHYYHGNGKFASAIWCYRRSLATKPDQSNIWAALGAVYELQGEHQEALRFYRRAIELEPALEEQIQPARLEGN